MIHIIDCLKKVIEDLDAIKIIKYKKITDELILQRIKDVGLYNDILFRNEGLKIKEKHLELVSVPGEYTLNWSTNDDKVYGAVEINNISNAISFNKIDVFTSDDIEDRIRNQFLKKAYYFDVPSRIITSNNGVVMLWDRATMSYPELWFMEDYKNFCPLELDLGTYFEALAVTKGFRYWQIFYLGKNDYKKYPKALTEPTEQMYPVFKKLFPDQDYTDLDRRFEERVKSKK